MLPVAFEMSLERALDDERREVMDILEGRSNQSADSANTPTGSSPLPVISMLDVDSLSAPSVPAIAVEATNPGDTPEPPVTRRLSNTSNPASKPSPRKQTTSKTFHKPGFGAPARTGRDLEKEGFESDTDYDLNVAPSTQGSASPRRASGEGKQSLGMRSLAAVMQGQQLSPLPVGALRGRHNLASSAFAGKPKALSFRPSARSQSPGKGLLSSSRKTATEDGNSINRDDAPRKLSDATSVSSSRDRAQSEDDNVFLSTGETWMQKDSYPDEEDGQDIESSDEERYGESSADEALDAENGRGRRRGRRRKGSIEDENNTDGSEADNIDIKKGPMASKYKVKSLLEPTVTITGPGGERLTVKRSGVHPNTNYDQSASRNASPTTSDSDELSDIRRAQRMQINSSPIDSSIPHRVIRTIIRGDFAKMQEEAEEGSRRLRTYLVATDLSGEAAYALEWTIGTVLRDGDTLLAVYAVDEEIGTGKTGDTDGLPIGEGAKAMQDTTALVEKMTTATQNTMPSSNPSPLSNPVLLPGSGRGSGAGSTDSRYLSKAEQERLHAIEGISQTCIKFLRKTKLQVRIAVEVIHCKSPKYMITEAVSPPLTSAPSQHPQPPYIPPVPLARSQLSY